MVDSPRHILALIPNWLGDVAMCTPALRTLHQSFPDAELTVAGRAPACALLGGLPYISRFHDFPARPGPIRMLSLGRALRPYAKDLTVVFPHSLRAAAIARLTGSRRVLAYARNSRSWLLTDPVEPNKEDGKISPVYMVWEYLDLLEGLGVAAAIGRVQLERLPSFNRARREHAAVYDEAFVELPLETPIEPTRYRHVYHQYTVRTTDRDALAGSLSERSIDTGIYYDRPIHRQPAYGSVSTAAATFPEARPSEVVVMALYSEWRHRTKKLATPTS